MKRRPPGSLQRRVFIWFGVTIVATAAVVGLGFWGISDAPQFRRRLEEGSGWLARRFEPVWERPAERDALLQETATAFDLSLTLHDAEGRVLAQHGPPCPHVLARAPVLVQGAPVGELSGCPAHRRHRGGLRNLIPFGLACLVIWGAAGLIARRLARPLVKLADVARDLGEGRLDSRVRLGSRAPPEVAEVATAVNDMADRLQRQIADQKELLAAVSHELRTPLGHMRLLVATARERWGSEADADKTLSGLDREITELDALTGALLASSRLELSEPTRVVVNPVDLAREALNRAGLEEDLLEAGEVGTASLDPTLIARALANLLDNAQRHARGATGLRVRRDDDAVVFEVLDDGDGPPIDEAWEAYRQGAGQQLSRGSLGLGLALVRRIAEAHGGEAYAQRREEGGALFALRLPASR